MAEGDANFIGAEGVTPLPAPVQSGTERSGDGPLPPSLVARCHPIILNAGHKAAWRFVGFFTNSIRNPNTREAYYRAVTRFFDWCESELNIQTPQHVRPIHVSTYVEGLAREMSLPSVKQHLAAIRKCFDYLVTGNVGLDHSPASPVKGPKYVVTKGKTKPLDEEQARRLLDSIDATTLIGLRDRALIAVMLYSFARVGAVVSMSVEDYYSTGKRWWFRLHEKGGKDHDVPAHHKAEEYMDAYLTAAGIGHDRKGPLFRPFHRKNHALMLREHLDRRYAWAMVKRRARAAGLPVNTKNHTFRATGITIFRKNGGSLADAQAIAAHASDKTTRMYDHSEDAIRLEEIERVRI